jgi:hypothetical protein
MKVNPVPGRLVRDPITGREVTEPTEVLDNDPFWIRRINDGDVTLAVAAAPASAKPVKGAD